jgi:beta-galactosidase
LVVSGVLRESKGKVSSREILLVAFLCLASYAGAAPPLSFDKLLVFTTTNSLRVECEVASTVEFRGVKLVGSIRRFPNGPSLWAGPLSTNDFHRGVTNMIKLTIPNLKPELWSPSSPALYQVKVIAQREDMILGEGSTRFGFRSFESRNSQFHLNGRPIFLRGIAINPPGRTIPAEVGESRKFAETYVRFLKQHNVNTIRMTHDSQVWFDVCDELGMMVYQGKYGTLEGAEEGKQQPPPDFDKSVVAYKQLFGTYNTHPSILIYILANELPVSGTRGRAFHDFLTRAHEQLKPWDPTRLYIGNAGYGEGREGDICDVHRYWGWYYNSFLTYYNLRDKVAARPLFGDPARNQPLTFTECVGCFTGSSGEFNLVRSKQLGAQLGWTGHAANQKEEALSYQSFMVKQATEAFRRLRPLNPRLSGIMPFTILFYNWSGIESFEQMKPKPAMEQMALSYQPVLMSWELWTKQVYAGKPLQLTAHIINDSESGEPLNHAKLSYWVKSKTGREIATGEIPLPPVPYYAAWSKALSVDLPAAAPTDEYIVSGEVINDGVTVSTNFESLFIAGSDWRKASPARPSEIYIYDPAGKSIAALQKLGIRCAKFDAAQPWPDKMRALIIGEADWDSTLSAHKSELRQFIHQGGRILCLQQNNSPAKFETDWLPEPLTLLTGSATDADYPPRVRPFRGQMNVNPERPGHPVFAGLDRHRLSLWSDYMGWDQTKPGFPQVYPVTFGFKLVKAESLARTAILANYDRGLEGIALCEMFEDTGSVILSGFDLINRIGLDPVADKLLANLVAYVSATEGHEPYPLIDSAIHWGEYASERGVLPSPLNGLAVNCEWVPPPTNPKATPIPANGGSWNMKPGDQFIANGRNPLGLFGYSTGSSIKDSNPETEIGSGNFWIQVPSGKKSMQTKVRNPATNIAKLSVEVNGMLVNESVEIPPGKTIDVTSPLPGNTNQFAIRYTGPKTLVLVETDMR